MSMIIFVPSASSTHIGVVHHTNIHQLLYASTIFCLLPTSTIILLSYSYTGNVTLDKMHLLQMHFIKRYVAIIIVCLFEGLC